MAVNDQEFKNALKLWASGVTVVTSKTEQHGIKGMTATSFSSVSLEPPQILVCINRSTDTGEVMLEGKHFAVNILTAEQQQVSNQFAGGSSQEERFANVAWHEGALGSPVLDEALASLECKVVQQVEAGTHWVVIGQVEEVCCRSGEPLLYFDSAYRELATR
ncbi:flavin reductase family protein [Methylomarinum sp. Ch1-1]|uniref:Flavin reductase family protein n=1 Tax=Methylomarinum roseum TaxID=3067653 RepID=A0AAU7NRQ5_9GAMM|nr:flavin reductase family protein [Methylomarinum sp. Ch1-1]MDP4520387.1 flavin reductase family protein [Methylomarinum sp. Ch1-1]